MAQFVVRDIESGVKSRLQRRARRHGQSMEAEVRDILRDAVSHEELSSVGLGSEITSLFSRRGLAGEIAELRGEHVRPARFHK